MLILKGMLQKRLAKGWKRLLFHCIREKAMTAIALLLALFKVRPSPFCVLDEVDAPLDEANGHRFNEMVREMSKHSQFIVITHNRKTMECADVLYGVTMADPGVSKLVSVALS